MKKLTAIFFMILCLSGQIYTSYLSGQIDTSKKNSLSSNSSDVSLNGIVAGVVISQVGENIYPLKEQTFGDKAFKTLTVAAGCAAAGLCIQGKSKDAEKMALVTAGLFAGHLLYKIL